MSNACRPEGDVCSGCRAVFGHVLRERSATPVDASRAELFSALKQRATLPHLAETKANQVCWKLCEARRTCTQINDRWECKHCRAIDGALP